MKKFLPLFLLFILIPCVFSAWQEMVGLAVFASFGLLIIIYMIAFGFEIENMKIMVREEMVQLIVTVVLAASIVGISAFMDSFTPQIVEVEGGGPGITMQEYALTTMNDILATLQFSFDQITSFGEKAMVESSKTHFCSFMSTGLFISSCNSYSLLSPALSLSMQAMAVSFVELQSLYTILNLGYLYSFTLLLPIGIFLRALKVTRGAGAFFIALGITFNLVLPITVIFMDDLDEYFAIHNPGSYPHPTELSISECNPTITGSMGGKVYMDNPDQVRAAFSDSLLPNLDAYVYSIFVRVNITLFVCLFVMITSIRWLSSALGVEVDVSAIARFA